MKFSDLTREEQEWLDAYLDGTIDRDSFSALENRMAESSEFRAVVRRYLGIDSSLKNRAEMTEPDSETAAWKELDVARKVDRSKNFLHPNLAWMALAAAVAFFLGLAARFWQSDSNDVVAASEPVAKGFAVINRVLDGERAPGEKWHRAGDILGSETFRLESGMAQIQFFCGAVMTVEGPAEISLKSAWEATCHEGAVRMKVPRAARGFTLHGPSSKIVDLGTEFGLVVRDGAGQLEVFDGEVALQHRDEPELILTKGAAFDLGNKSNGEGFRYPDMQGLGSKADEQLRSHFSKWESHRDQLSKDERLIAYYTFDEESDQPFSIPNLTIPRNRDFDGTVVLAQSVDGRWPGLKSALEFGRPGSRVRVNISGEFSAYTFACWVRIDSLDRWYNALFMGDGYETGEPHWQIRNDGKLMLSVMVDDSKPNPGSPNDAGFHRVYYSPPFWDMSMSGQWIHLASVFDPANREVCHYVNGEQIHKQEMVDRFYIDTLRIGNGEIGNWGQPFREDPTFAIRNLNGRIDEMAIFRAALSVGEIEALYEASRGE